MVFKLEKQHTYWGGQALKFALAAKVVLLDCPLEYKKGESRLAERWPSPSASKHREDLLHDFHLNKVKPMSRSQKSLTGKSYCNKRRQTVCHLIKIAWRRVFFLRAIFEVLRF